MRRGKPMPSGRRTAAVAMVGVVAALLTTTAAAQIPEIRFARQFSMGYLKLNIMEHHKLLEKHAKAAGVGEVKVVWATFNSPAAMNDAFFPSPLSLVPGAAPGGESIGRRKQAICI